MSHSRSNGCLSLQHGIPFPVPNGWLKSCSFAWNLRVVSCRNDTMWAIRGSYMLSEAPLIINMHVRNVINHSITNGCLSLQHAGIPFTMWIWFPTFEFCFKFESWFWQKWHGADHKKLVCAIRSCSNHCYTSKKGYMKHSSSNGWLCTSWHIPSPMLKGSPRPHLSNEFESSFQQKW